MRTLKTILKLTLGATLLVAATTSTLGQSNWETVDSVVYPADGPSAHFTDLAAANDGNLYAAGYDVDTAGNIESSWLRRSADGGSTCQNTASFAGYLKSIAVDAHGHIYLAGRIPVDGQWTVLRSEDQGASWTTLDSDLLPAFWPADIAVDATGTIWLAGYYRPDPNYGNASWVVLRGTPAPTGVAWKDVDPYSFDTAGLAKPDRIHDGRPMTVAIRPMTVGLPEIFVGGRAANQRSGFLWVVRRSRDGGTTWSTIDQFPSADIGPMDLAFSPTDGSIYAVGRIYETLTRKTGQYVSLVRRGVSTSTGGIAWTNVDRVIANPYSVLFRNVAVDGYGRVFAAGLDYNNYGWLVRASIDGVAPYVTTDGFAPGSPAAVVADPANNVFVAGWGGSGAIIRRLAAPQP